MALVDRIIGAESGGDPNARNPNSSASGAGQFIDGTWLDTIKAARPDLAAGKSDADLLALKADPQLSRQMTDAYATQNAGILSKAGLPVTPGTTYLAHFAGPGGAVGVLNADPSTPAGAILGPAVVKANPFLANMTAADLTAWADRKMGGATPARQAAPLAMGGPPAPQPAPVQQAQQQPAPQYGAASPAASPMADPAAPAPFALLPPRPKIDLASVYANLRRG